MLFSIFYLFSSSRFFFSLRLNSIHLRSIDVMGGMVVRKIARIVYRNARVRV